MIYWHASVFCDPASASQRYGGDQDINAQFSERNTRKLCAQIFKCHWPSSLEASILRHASCIAGMCVCSHSFPCIEQQMPCHQACTALSGSYGVSRKVELELIWCISGSPDMRQGGAEPQSGQNGQHRGQLSPQPRSLFSRLQPGTHLRPHCGPGPVFTILNGDSCCCLGIGSESIWQAQVCCISKRQCCS